MSYTDNEIIEELTRGNTEILKKLYADFYKITGYVLSNHGSEEEAKDIFHDALIALYHNIRSGKFSLNSKLSTYLYSICKYRWLNYLRDHRAEIISTIDEVEKVSEFESDSDGPNDALEREKEFEEKKEVITKILEKIGEPCYSILNMFYFKKFSMKMIAEKLKYKTEKVAKNQRYRCILKLRQMLPEDFIHNYYQ